MKIHPAANAIPEMTAEEFAALKEDISKRGLLVPVETYKGQVIDGRHRLKACAELGIDPDFIEVTLDGISPGEYVWSVNGARRHLTPAQRACVALELMPELKADAKQRQLAGLKQNRDRPGNNSGTDAGEARDQAAALVGVNPRYVSDAERVRKESPELFRALKSAAVTVPDAIREIKRKTIKEQLESVEAVEAKAVQGVYDVIVIDPPWPMQKIERQVRPNQSEFDYPVMQESELAELKLPAADDCHVWLWTTHKFLPMAFRLLEVWRLKYVCAFVWHKPGGFQPIGLPQYNCEFALYARRGSPEFIDTKAFPTCFDAPRGEHSEKPEAFYDVVRRVTAGRRLDMFNRRAIEGFDVWGKEAADVVAT